MDPFCLFRHLIPQRSYRNTHRRSLKVNRFTALPQAKPRRASLHLGRRHTPSQAVLVEQSPHTLQRCQRPARMPSQLAWSSRDPCPRGRRVKRVRRHALGHTSFEITAKHYASADSVANARLAKANQVLAPPRANGDLRRTPHQFSFVRNLSAVIEEAQFLDGNCSSDFKPDNVKPVEKLGKFVRTPSLILRTES
jgi:hypothetical protein